MAQDQTNEVTAHYDRWPFPGQVFSSEEGLLLVRHLQSCLKEIARATKASPRIIDVGCGTGHTTLGLARLFPDATFLGVDVSSESLAIARRTASERKARNVTFEKADLTQTMTRFGSYQVVLSLGVLHHIERMSLAFDHLVGLIANGGHLFLWLYGKQGRLKHNLNQMFLSTLSSGLTDSERFSVAEAFLSELGTDFVAGTGFYSPQGTGEPGIAYLREHPQWLADQMIPAFEEPLTLADILELFEASGLHFNRWLGVPVHLNYYTSSALLLNRFEALSPRERLLAIDCLIKPENYFVMGKKPATSGVPK